VRGRWAESGTRSVAASGPRWAAGAPSGSGAAGALSDSAQERVPAGEGTR
jgi:hypothetical protein